MYNQQKCFITILLLSLLFTNQVYASFSQDMLMGARPMAMGGAFVAVADDCNAIPSNSAGLAQIENHQILLGYSQLYFKLDYGNINRIFICGVYTMKKLLNIGVYYNRLGTSCYNENSLIIALSRRLARSFSFGLNFKYLFWDSAPVKLYNVGNVEEELDGSGISLDFGGIIKINSNLKFGFTFTDINQPDISSELSIIEEKVPYSIKLGIGYNLNKWLICADFILRKFSFSQKSPQSREILKKVGVEYPFLDYNLHLRAGISFYNIFEGFNLSAGAGYELKQRYKINYAFVMPFFSIKSTYGSHYLDISYNF